MNEATTPAYALHLLSEAITRAESDMFNIINQYVKGNENIHWTVENVNPNTKCYYTNDFSYDRNVECDEHNAMSLVLNVTEDALGTSYEITVNFANRSLTLPIRVEPKSDDTSHIALVPLLWDCYSEAYEDHRVTIKDNGVVGFVPISRIIELRDKYDAYYNKLTDNGKNNPFVMDNRDDATKAILTSNHIYDMTLLINEFSQK